MRIEGWWMDVPRPVTLHHAPRTGSPAPRRRSRHRAEQHGVHEDHRNSHALPVPVAKRRATSPICSYHSIRNYFGRPRLKRHVACGPCWTLSGSPVRVSVTLCVCTGGAYVIVPSTVPDDRSVMVMLMPLRRCVRTSL
jgi:hypothetical protein